MGGIVRENANCIQFISYCDSNAVPYARHGIKSNVVFVGLGKRMAASNFEFLQDVNDTLYAIALAAERNLH